MVLMLAILRRTSAEPSICPSRCHSKLKYAVAGGHVKMGLYSRRWEE
jgi:hypothetical protein